MASVFTIRQAGKDNGQAQILRIDVTNYVTVTNSCFTFDCPYKHNATTEVVEYKDVIPNGSMSIVANVNCSTFDYIRIAVAGHGTAMFHFQDEFKGEKYELKAYKLTGKNKKTKVPVELDPSKRYQIMFLVKNRFGSSNEFCIVFLKLFIL